MNALEQVYFEGIAEPRPVSMMTMHENKKPFTTITKVDTAMSAKM